MIDREKLIKFFANHCAIYNATACPKSSNGKCTIRECATCLADDFITNGVTVLDEPIKMVIPEGVDKKALIEMIRNAPIQILPGEPVQEWISVTERLPSTFTDVISYNAETASFQVDCLDERGKWYSEYKYSDYSPTHWMPLPKPPKGE